MAETIPQSRIEDILDGAPVPKPQSRIEQLLLDGGGGVPDNVYTKGEVNSLLSYKVDKVNGKGLSTEDYTTDEKTKLEGIEPEANKTIVDTELDEGSTNPVENKAVYEALSGKVDKVNGKQLSTEDYTTAEKNKLANIDPNIDSTPTSESSHPVSSGGVYTALTGKVDKVQGKGLSTEDFTAMYKAWLDVSMQSPLNHNGIFRGKDLTDVYTIDQMYSMIHTGTFDDIFLGDYFTKSITTDIMTRFTGTEFESGTIYYEMGGGTDVTARTWTETEDSELQSGKTYATKETKTENVTSMFAAFDYYYKTGDRALAVHHAGLIPREYGFETTAKMNQTNTTEGGYFGSDMHQITLPCYAKSIKAMLNNHLLSHKTLLPNAINASTPSMAGAGMMGASSGVTWCETELQLMNEIQLYGSTVCSSSAYDVGVDNRQLPVFKFINPVHVSRGTMWLRSVVSSTSFTTCTVYGNANHYGASGTNYVRPLILFG